MPKDLTLFKERVSFLANNDHLNIVETNGGPFEARIVISQIFESSKEHIQMYVTEFDNELYDSSEVVHSVGNFLKKQNSKLTIFAHRLSNLDDCTSLDILLKNHADKVNINNTSVNLIDDDKDVNFIIGDSSYYRIENDIKKHTAVFNFGDTNFVEHISSNIIPVL